MVVENGDGDWFRWVLGLLVAAATGISGWLATLYVGVSKDVKANSREIGELKTKVAVLESRPYIDPVKHAESMANMANALTMLAHRLEQNNADRKQAFEDLREQIKTLATAVQELRDELMVPG